MTSKTEKWFITGASGGLGLALTRRVLEAGNTVVAAVRNPPRWPNCSSSLPDSLSPRNWM